MFEDILDNPVPSAFAGDPGLIERFARNYSSTADALRHAATELRALANDNVTISLAVDKVRDRADGAYLDTIKVAERYEGAAETYHAYQSALSAAQTQANAARTQVAHNNDNARYWRRQQRELQLEVLTDPSKATELVTANHEVSHYDAEFHRAMHQYNIAVEDKRRAVVAAMAGLDDAATLAGLNDNLFEAAIGVAEVLYDLAQKYLTPILQRLRAVLEIIKSIVDIISLIVSIASIFLPLLAPLAAALALASMALSVAILLCSLTLMALGKETIGRVLGDVINVAASVVSAKLAGAFKPRALSGLGAIASGAAWKTAAHGATRMTVKAVARNIAETYAEDLAVSVPADSLNFVAAPLDIDTRGGGASWNYSAPSSDEAIGGAVDIVWGAATGGVTTSIGDMSDAAGELRGSFSTDLANVSAYMGVPSE
jgi:hypothetical protein